ncbi:MAG: plasmid mobilization relaxosome protein MobC [Micropepsaceae bacterium]
MPLEPASGGKSPAPHGRAGRPFSLRLSADERARLTREASGAPLGPYIRAKVLGDPPPVAARRSGLPVEDRKALAQVLALLGQSRIASNLNQLAHAAHIGALAIDPEIERDLTDAIAFVRELRRLLLAALGLKPEGVT